MSAANDFMFIRAVLLGGGNSLKPVDRIEALQGELVAALEEANRLSADMDENRLRLVYTHEHAERVLRYRALLAKAREGAER